ncbi:MAG: DUF6279 family lipoprotein [Pseudomonadota bacterium]
MGRFRLFTIIPLVVSLYACSATQLVYNNANWLVQNQIDNYFALSGEQESTIELQTNRFFAWHRTQELPVYSKIIDDFSTQFSDHLTEEEVNRAIADVFEARTRIVRRSLQPASEFLSTLTPQQIDHFDSVVQEQLAERREQLVLSIEERRDIKFDALLDTLQDWFGDFDRKQVAKLRQHYDDIPNNDAYWLALRERRHTQLLKLLKAGAPTIDIYTLLHDRYVTRRANDMEQDKLSNEFVQNWTDFFLTLDQLISARQRQHLLSELKGYQENFLALSQQIADAPVTSIDKSISR